MKSNKLAKISVVLVMVGCIAGGASTICAKWNKDPNERYNKLIDTANSYIEKGYYIEAINELEEAEKLNSDEDVEFTIAECYFKTGDYVNFDSKLESIESTYGSSERLYIDYATYYIETCQSDMALEKLIKAKKEYPDSQQILAAYDQIKGLYTEEGGNYAYKAELCDGYEIAENNSFGIDYEEIFDVSSDDSIEEIWKGSSEIISAKVGGVSGYYDMDGNKRLSSETNYTYLGGFRDGYALIESDKGWGYMNTDFEESGTWYEAATSFNEGVAAVKKNGKWGFIDTDFNMITDFIYDEVVEDNFERCFVGAAFAKKDGSYVMLDAKGDEIKGDIEKLDMFRSSSDYAAILDANGWQLIDTSGEIIYQLTCDELRASSHGISAVMIDGKWGYAGVNDGMYVQCSFDEAGYVNEDGYTAVKEGDEWTFIHFTRFKDNSSIL